MRAFAHLLAAGALLACGTPTATRAPGSDPADAGPALSDSLAEPSDAPLASPDVAGPDLPAPDSTPGADIPTGPHTPNSDALNSDILAQDTGVAGDTTPPACIAAAAATATPLDGCGTGAVVAEATRTCGDTTVSFAALGHALRARFSQDGAAHWTTGAIVATPSAPGVGWACDDTLVVCTETTIATVSATCTLAVGDAAGDPLVVTQLTDAHTLTFEAAANERYTGLGPQTGGSARRGRRFELWNTDAFDATFGGYAPDAQPLYQSIPLLTVSRPQGDHSIVHGIFVDSARRQTWDLQSADAGSWTVSADGGALDVYVLPGPTLAAVLDRYTALTGRPALPPLWALGYHQSRWGWPDAEAVLAVAQRFRSEQIPCDSLWLDIQKLDGFRSFTWDPATFPSPAGLTDALAAAGFRAVAIVDPAIKQDAEWDVYSAGLTGNHFLGTPPYVGEVWPGPAVFPDFTRPTTRAWWASLVPRETSKGVAGLWIDMNEPSDFKGPGGTVPLDLPVDGNGQGGTMADAHNVYALWEAEATRDGLLAALPTRRPFVLTRAGYSGIQRYAMAWTGDAPSRPDVLADSLPMLLSMGLSGTPFVGTDVGGYSGSADPALFVRWMALGSISPFFRGHAERNAPPSMPWDFGVEARDISRALIQARYRLLPYWYSLADEARRTGAPLLRPISWHFPQSESPDDEALLGPFMLVAPLLSPSATERSVVFPPGRWFDVASGAVVEGPTTRTVHSTLAALPMWAREGAIIPRGPVQPYTNAVAGPLELSVYPPRPGVSAGDLLLFEDEGDGPEATPYRRVRLHVEGTASGMTLTAAVEAGSTWVPPSRDVVVRIQRVDVAPTAVVLNGAPVGAVADATSTRGWSWDSHDLALVVRFSDAGPFALSASYTTSLGELAPPVSVPLRVKAPPGTTSPLYVAHSGNAWQQQPLSPDVTPGYWVGAVQVPRGEWFEYKYTRGGWSTVEKWPGCAEASNRYAYGAAHPNHVSGGSAPLLDPGKQDEVFVWADICP